MSIKIKYCFQTPKSYYGLKKQFRSLLGTEMLIFHKKSNDIYCSPIQVKLKHVNDNFIICERKNGYYECFNYNDFFCGNVIYHTIGR